MWLITFVASCDVAARGLAFWVAVVRADVQLQITVSFEDRLLAQLYALDLARCPPWVPNLALSKIYVTLNSGDPQHTTLLLDGGERGDFYIRSPESM